MAVTIGPYEGNTPLKSFSYGLASAKNDFMLTGLFHTHPNGDQYKTTDRYTPSGADLNDRDDYLKRYPHAKFYILTGTASGDNAEVEKISYTIGW